MESPFVYGKNAKGKSFIDRKDEIKHLINNFTSGTNTIIISPPRWGKSSLIQKGTRQILRNNRQVKICHIDLFRIQDERHFFEYFLLEVLKASSNRLEDWMSTTNELLKGIVTSVSIGTDSAQDIRLRIAWDNLIENEQVILDLPEKIAKRRKMKFIICIDKFQKIAGFKNSLHFQQKLRAHWEDHSHTWYVLSGSRRNVISELITTPSMPFYRFGELVSVQKIKPKHWHGYIEHQFKTTGKSIGKEFVDRILEVAAHHPYHIQQLCHTLWRFCKKNMDSETFDICLKELWLNNDILFKREIENLTPLQIRYLTAMLNSEPHLNSIQTIRKYKLGSPGNLSTVKSALENKEIIDFYDSEPTFINPLFAYWLRYVLKLNASHL